MGNLAESLERVKRDQVCFFAVMNNGVGIHIGDRSAVLSLSGAERSWSGMGVLNNRANSCLGQ